MKRQFIAFMAVAALSLSAMAQIDKRDLVIPNPDENACEGKCDMGEQKPACPFEGIKLSDKQKNQLKKLDDARKADCEKKMAEKKAQAEAKKADAQKKREEMKKQREEEKAQMLIDRKNYLKEVQQILTADQYLQFLENFYLNAPQPNMGPRGGHGPGMAPGRGGKDMPKPFRKPGERRLRPVDAEPQLVKPAN